MAVTRTVGALEVLQDITPVHLAEPGDEASLAAAISAALDSGPLHDPEILVEIGRRCSWRATAAGYTDLCERIAGK